MTCDLWAGGEFCHMSCMEGYGVPVITANRGEVNIESIIVCSSDTGKWSQELIPDCEGNSIRTLFYYVFSIQIYNIFLFSYILYSGLFPI